MRYGAKYGTSKWYAPGAWSLPRWWTDGPPVRGTSRCTHQELEKFYSSPFVTNVLGHTGGITELPKEKEDGKDERTVDSDRQ